MSIPSNWYEDFFHGISLDLWRQAIAPEQTIAEADFLVDKLKCEAGSRLLDVPCGNGRLSLELARRGYRVSGIDLAKEFIDEAKAAAAGKLPAEFELGDMRRIEGDAIYDGAYCFGNSFGFLVYEDTQQFLKAVHRALKPGARFIIETGMAAESALTKFETHASHQIGDIKMTINERYLADESCIDTEYVFERSGLAETRRAKHWIYTVGEIRRMFEQAGFAVQNLYGSLSCKPYELGSDELFVIAQRV
jgi:cyclopropane fatty-acyl-phospholipid synthase-like methyltransferase